MNRRLWCIALLLLFTACNYVEQAKQAATGPAPTVQPATPAPVAAEPATAPPIESEAATPAPATPSEPATAEANSPAIDPDGYSRWVAKYVEIREIAKAVDDFAFDRVTVQPSEAPQTVDDWRTRTASIQNLVPQLSLAGKSLLEMISFIDPRAKGARGARFKSYQAAKLDFERHLAAAAPPTDTK